MPAPNEAWQITAPGVITLNDLGFIPSPGPKEVLIRIAAFALNYRDKLVINHSDEYPLKAEPNLIPGSDAAGVIESIGSGSRWKKDDQVIIHPNKWLTGTSEDEWRFDETMGCGGVNGTFRRWMVVGDNFLVPAPKGLPLEEAAGMYTAGATAWRAMFREGVEVKPGMAVLTQGTGGVSSYGIRIAAAAGATVVATSSSDAKLEIARKLGATHLINYLKTPSWSSEVKRVTDGKGVDLVLDVVGAESIEETMKATKHGGKIVVTGLLSSNPNQKVDIMTEILYGAKTGELSEGSSLFTCDPVKASLETNGAKVTGQLGAGSRKMSEELSAFLEQHQLHPPTAATFEFEDAPKALQELDRISKPGKIIVKC